MHVFVLATCFVFEPNVFPSLFAIDLYLQALSCCFSRVLNMLLFSSHVHQIPILNEAQLAHINWKLFCDPALLGDVPPSVNVGGHSS